MPNIKLYQRSFAGGEISPEMFGRIDDVKYQTGAALMRNMIATPQGPLENRPGFQYVRETRNSTYKSRLIPFTYSTDQSLVIELGIVSQTSGLSPSSTSYMRFHTQGGTLLYPAAPAYVAEKTIQNPIAPTDTITCIDHGFSDKDPIHFTGGTLPANLSANTTYYLLYVSTSQFKVRTSPDGAAIPDVGAGAAGTIKVWYSYDLGDFATYSGTTYYYNTQRYAAYGVPTTGNLWFAQPASGELTIPTHRNDPSAGQPNYREEYLFDIHYVQSNDVLTLVHPQRQPMELRRLGATKWTMTPVLMGTLLPTPTGVTATPTLGSYSAIATYTGSVNSVAAFTTVGTHNLLAGDPVYIKGMGVGGNRLKVGTGGTPFASGFFVVATLPTSPSPQDQNFTLKDYATGEPVLVAVTAATGPYVSGDGKVTYWARISDTNQRYVVTSVNDKLEESPQSSEAACENNLFVSGAYNTISWTAVPGAVRYNVYKKQSGLYGFIGQAVGTSFVDDNIAPDMGVTPPIYDASLDGPGNYPAAVTYYEQRRSFGGTVNAPQGVWMTRSATESDLSYSIPTQDTDRIAFRIAAREANTIRHMVPLQQLVLLTNSAEWRVTSVNNDALTPFSLSVRPQSYIGANNVQPSIINTSMVYCAARGGHVREMGYSWQNNGYITGDLSLRAAHLFDGYTISDMTYSKAPKPLLWFVSSTGKLLGLTYIPEEQVGAWHQHDTDGTFESCAAIPEGDEDSLYVIVRRTINGNSKRYIERMSTRNFSSLEACFFVDSGRTFNGANTDPTKTVTLSGGSQWVANEVVTVTASAPGIFTGASDIGDAIVVTGADGTKYKVLITQYTSATVVQGKLDKALPAALRNVATSDYAFARDTVSGLSHLEGMDVSVLADGVVLTGKKVQSGAIALGAPYSLVHVGLPYESDLQTVPVTFQAEAFGKGVFKNINKVVIATFQSSTFYVGPNASLLVKSDPYASSPGFDTGDVDVVVQPRWNWTGQTYVRQADPLPLTITSICYEAVIGGS